MVILSPNPNRPLQAAKWPSVPLDFCLDKERDEGPPDRANTWVFLTLGAEQIFTLHCYRDIVHIQ